ncbi:hybrid sensor histidine kinase/response regulator [Tenuifilum thalassicum]|uniref:histidine kinase n=2 Tax=Tenuifilum thalassicum TaxID=2590900 RepID=A0A7D3XF71_9BACT|nr:hybrid sensor histidine kinase/response regulator [Tenuifilum thalassicum]
MTYSMKPKGKILVVDDSESILAITSDMLQSEGYEIIKAKKGFEALELLSKHNPDLVLLDKVLPDLDGFEVCRAIKKMKGYESIPIIFLTATSQSEAIVEGFDIGAVDYVVKPFQKAELLARVRTHVELFQLNKDLEAKTIALQENEVRLKSLIATKEKLFSIIIHDLKAPLFNIKLISDLLFENYGKKNFRKVDELLTYLNENTERVTGLMENLVDWAKMQMDTISFEPKVINLNEAVKETVTLLESIATNKGVSIANQIDPEIKVYADFNLLSAVLRNLVSNAIKFSKQGGVVRISSAVNADKMAEVAVSDNGIGIEPDRLKTLFGIKTHNSTEGTNGEKGLGLGLSVCKEFVEINRGTIWVKSEVGKGSSFHFTIPRA